MTESRIHFLLPGVSAAPIGGYKVVYEYANALVAQGAAVTVWHCTAFAAFTGGRFDGLRYARLAGGQALRPGSLSGGPSWFSLDRRVVVRNTARLPHPRLSPGDVVVATAYETTEYAGRLARAARARSVAFIQHLETWAADETRIVDAWARVDDRIVIAPWLAERCVAAGLTAHLLPNALDSDSFPLGPPLASRSPSVLSLLSPHSYKRPDVVAATLERLAEQRPGVGLAAFGTEAEPPVPIPGVTYHCDPSPALLRELYRSASVYLCGSDAEGWHLPPAEATLSGAAVVSTDIGGVRASMGDDAVYAPAGDPAALASAVLSVLEDLPAAQARVDRAERRLRAVTYAANAREFLRLVGIDRSLTPAEGDGGKV